MARNEATHRGSGARSRLWRYNAQILAGMGYWVVVLPVAASQVVTLWMMAMAGDFGPLAATRIAELMTPVLGAFLAAHTLAPEYRGGVGAVLASKPVSLHRVVTVRAALAMLGALLLTAVTLGSCSLLVHPIDLRAPLLAAVPSCFFLSTLALAFATLFRNALGGFAVAAGVWALDVTVGYGAHPLFSMQGLSARMDNEPLAQLWPLGKAALLLAGCVLLWLHGRMLRRIHQTAERRDVLRVGAATAAVWLLYCASGAAAMVGYAYLHRARLDRPDVTWLRRQLRAYGPVPVARFFGPAFAAYVAEPTVGNDNVSLSELRVRQLEQALQRWPRSIWADGMAYALAGERQRIDPVRAVADYFAVADRHPNSPFAPKALVQVARAEASIPEEARLLAARRLVRDYPGQPEVETAAATLRERYPGAVTREELIGAARAAAAAGSRLRRPEWLLLVASLYAEAGSRAEATAAAQEALQAGRALVAEDQRAGPLGEVRPHRVRIDGAIRDAEALLARLARP